MKVSFRKGKGATRREIRKAQRYLEKTHKISGFKYIKTTIKEGYTRHHFSCTEYKNMVFVVLTNEEKKKVEEKLKAQNGEGYEYIDTIIASTLGAGEHHRFRHTKNKNSTATTFLEEDGKTWVGYFSGDDDF